MSDDVRDLAERFERDVQWEQPRKLGLFPIPELPELESRGMWTSAFDVLLTTLRYLAPATLLTLFWGQQSFLFRLLKCIDNALRPIVFSNEEQKKEILQWISSAGPVRVERLETVWRHGWVLCGVLDAALPGTCQGHAPASLPLTHAKTIASQYLGVESVFTDKELEANGSLSKHQEWKLISYLDQIRKALAKLTPPVSKPTSQRTSPEMPQLTFDYVARGSGLAAAQINNMMHFKIYPTSQQCINPGEITILIRGPKDTYGMKVIPPILGKAQLIRQQLLGLQNKPIYTENTLPITQGVTYLRNFGRNDMNKTYFIPKPRYDIEIEVDMKADYAKVGYVVNLEGKYEISITTRGQNIVGSPYSIKAAKNIFDIIERESFNLEDGEEIDILDVKSDRKVVLRIVDFVTEKMLLRENGTLEKITEDEAKILMDTEEPSQSDIESRTCSVQSTVNEEYTTRLNKFNKAARKIVQMNRVCKVINSLLAEKRKKMKSFSKPRSQQSIPDIVNSTFGDINFQNPFKPDKREKYTVLENINVDLQTQEQKQFSDSSKKLDKIENIGKTALNTISNDFSQDSLNTFEGMHNLSAGANISKEKPNSSSNPFLTDSDDQNYAIEKDLGAFVKTEYETNKSHNEETEETPIKILIDSAGSPTPSPPPTNTNPFVEPDFITYERPKTPVLKIITGEIVNREDSVFVDPLKTEEIYENEYINPLFLRRREETNERIPVADFIIGAPVSMPPLIRAITPEPQNIDENRQNGNIDTRTEEEPESAFSTPLPTIVHQIPDNQKVCSLTFYSVHSSTSDLTDNSNLPNIRDNPEIQVKEDGTPKKDLWDSAYVSIDDANSSPDSNNNESNTNKTCDLDYNNMGPAEREIWESCGKLIQSNIHQEEAKPKWDVKRPLFTPILEESDRSISTGLKDIRSDSGPLAVTVAFAELNDVYRNFFPRDQSDSPVITTNRDRAGYRKEGSVDSASELSDVMRHAENQEGEISEVQANATESESVSQNLRQQQNQECPIGDNIKSNIVLEKKQYWDKRIQEIQAQSSDEDLTQRRRKLSARYLRHNDSLTKKRGKQLNKNYSKSSNGMKEIVSRKSPISHDSPDLIQKDVNIVEKWKNYWDNKLQEEKEDTEITCWRAKSPKSKESSVSPQKSRYSTSSDDFIEAYEYNEPLTDKSKSFPGKQELPEEVFKAFETSPKRFFGTSRKHILNKIDTFLGKSNTTDDVSPEHSGIKVQDNGLVSSRITLFHTISKTDELTLPRRKSQSMHNISQSKNSDKNFTPIKQNKSVSDPDKPEKYPLKQIIKKPGFERKFSTILSQGSTEFEPEQPLSLKEKRNRIVQSTFNKQIDDSSFPHDATPVQSHECKQSGIKHIEPTHKHKAINALRKSSVSKSEMDIFSRMTNKPVEDDLDKHKSMEELPKINVKSFINLYEKVSRADENKPVRKLSRTKSLGMPRVATSMSNTKAVNKSFSSSYASKFDKTTSETDESTTDLTQSPSRRCQWGKDLESASSGSYEPRSLDSVDLHIVSNTDVEKQTTYVSLSDIELEIVENIDEPVKTVKKEEITEELPIQTEPESTEINSIDYKSRFKRAKEFFQSFEELRELKKPKQLNECEILLLSSKSSESTESLDKEPKKEKIQKRVKKNIKSHSVVSSEISKFWNELKDIQNSSTNKLVKISEKFNVKDLFSDVMEGRLSRQGSLRGIPHKKAVLETFRSMENLTTKKICSYELAATQALDFSKENKVKNAQPYLSEYPYLPTTAPSKFQSRFDVSTSGLITLKELQSQLKPRRNSVPDLRLNPTFTVTL